MQGKKQKYLKNNFKILLPSSLSFDFDSYLEFLWLSFKFPSNLSINEVLTGGSSLTLYGIDSSKLEKLKYLFIYH